MKKKIDGGEIAPRHRRLASGRFLERLRDTCGELGEKTKGKGWRRGPVYAMRWPIIGRAPRSGMLI